MPVSSEAPTPNHASAEFDADCRRAVSRLRTALLDLYQSAGADPIRPQDVSRRFNLNKNLTWKVAKVIQCEDALEAVPLIPGSEGLGILLGAMESAGVPADRLSGVREAAHEFERMVELHTGDRATLELLLDNRTGSKSLEVSRKLAFRGNSGIWGLQAGLRLTAHFLAPNAADPSRLDAALVAGLFDIRRLRPIPRWPLFRFTQFHRLGAASHAPLSAQTLGPGTEPASPNDDWMLPAWCVPPTPPVVRTVNEREVGYDLVDGPLGRMGSSTCVYGMLQRSAFSRYASEGDAFGEVSSAVTLPIETLLFDVFVHRDLPEALLPEAIVYLRPGGSLPTDPDAREALRLPIGETLIRLGGQPPQVATPLVPNYERLVASVFDRVGWDPREFMATRLVLAYPPMPSTVVLRHRLPNRPD